MLVHPLGLSDFADASSSVNYAGLVDASSFSGTVALQTLVHLSEHHDIADASSCCRYNGFADASLTMPYDKGDTGK
jgi:hypothetical protein